MESEKKNYGVKDIETILSTYNSKTFDYQFFKEYIKQESIFNPQMESFYHQEIWRKMKWRVWINRRRIEDQFLNRIEKIYGRPVDIIICYGNWIQFSKTQQMKYLMPNQGVGLRRLINKSFRLSWLMSLDFDVV